MGFISSFTYKQNDGFADIAAILNGMIVSPSCWILREDRHGNAAALRPRSRAYDEARRNVQRSQGSDGGLPDSKMQGCIRTLYNVIGFQPPRGEGDAVTSPVGDEASRLAAIPISEGFNLGYCRAKPGNGPMMHNHL
jgi:hypothetical protein